MKSLWECIIIILTWISSFICSGEIRTWKYWYLRTWYKQIYEASGESKFKNATRYHVWTCFRVQVENEQVENADEAADILG